MFQSWARLHPFHQSPAHHCTPRTPSVGPSMRIDKRDQNEQTQVMSFPPISPTALVSLSELDCSDFAPTETTPFPFEPTPQHIPAPSPIPASPNISASRKRQPSRHSQGHILSLTPLFCCSWLPLARQGAIRGKATTGAAFTTFQPFHGLFAPCQMSQQLTRAQLGRPPFRHLACPRYLHARTHIHRRPCHHNTGKAANRLGLELAPDGLEQDSVLPPYPPAGTVPRTLSLEVPPRRLPPFPPRCICFLLRSDMRAGTSSIACKHGSDQYRRPMQQWPPE